MYIVQVVFFLKMLILEYDYEYGVRTLCSNVGSY